MVRIDRNALSLCLEMEKDQKKGDLIRLSKKLRQNVTKAIYNFNMIEAGDKIMVCLSGGKDSYTMLDLLLFFQKSANFDFEIVAVNLDQKQPGFPEEVLPNYLDALGVDYRIVERDTYSIVKEKVPEGKTTCSLCSRLRRGTLYGTAKKLNCNKVALGHHRDDIIETMFLNIFFAGKMETMPPKYRTDDNAHVVIRPLCYIKEKDIAEFSELTEYPIIPCNLCGSQPNLQRQVVKQMLRTWDEKYPGRSESIFKAMRNISPSHMLDFELYDFKSLTPKLLIPDEML